MEQPLNKNKIDNKPGLIQPPRNNKPALFSPKPPTQEIKNIPKNTPIKKDNSGSNGNNGDNNESNNKNMPPKKKSLYRRIKNKTKSGYQNFKSKLTSPLELELDVDTVGMVPVEEYKKELLEKEEKKQDDSSVEMTEDYDMPALELDEYLRNRFSIKSTEFKRLQKTYGFYFSDTLDSQILERARLNEGMFLIGVNLNSLADLYKHIVFKEPLLDADGNPIPVPGEGDILESGRSEDLVGESYKVDYDKIYRDKMGFRLGPHRQLRPEDVLRNDTPFDDIIRESAKYTGSSYQRISPKSLLNMIQVLDEYSKYENQWLRSATAIEIIYKYMSNGMSREIFFNSESRLTEESLLELEEFFKTDNLFMTLDEIREFKNDLNFYRSEKNRQLINKNQKKERELLSKNTESIV
jgi:hypothetical protein